jgi:hypothetical protein
MTCTPLRRFVRWSERRQQPQIQHQEVGHQQPRQVAEGEVQDAGEHEASRRHGQQQQSGRAHRPDIPPHVVHPQRGKDHRPEPKDDQMNHGVEQDGLVGQRPPQGQLAAGDVRDEQRGLGNQGVAHRQRQHNPAQFAEH